MLNKQHPDAQTLKLALLGPSRHISVQNILKHGRKDTLATDWLLHTAAACSALLNHSIWSPRYSTCLLKLPWLSCPQRWWRSGLHRLTTFASGFRGQHPSSWDWQP